MRLARRDLWEACEGRGSGGAGKAPPLGAATNCITLIA